VAKFHTWGQKVGGRARGRCKWDLSKGLIILGKKSTKITICEGGKKKRKRVHTYSHTYSHI